jgi:hypothetical protein
MVELANDGYPGPYTSIMLSALTELKIALRDRDKFNWSNVSPSDPRVQSSEWLEENMKGARLTEFFNEKPLLME